MALTVLELQRRKRGFTVRKLARQAGYIENAISQIEHGHRKAWPRLRARVAQALDVPETELFTSDGWCRTIEIEELLRAVR